MEVFIGNLNCFVNSSANVFYELQLFINESLRQGTKDNNVYKNWLMFKIGQQRIGLFNFFNLQTYNSEIQTPIDV